jgi:hypothetical protein
LAIAFAFHPALVPGPPEWETDVDHESRIRVLFKRDPDAPELRHVFARHLTSPEDAIKTFFAAPAWWNDRYRRQETFTDTHGLYWVWVRPGRIVRVITCFRLEEH